METNGIGPAISPRLNQKSHLEPLSQRVCGTNAMLGVNEASRVGVDMLLDSGSGVMTRSEELVDNSQK